MVQNQCKRNIFRVRNISQFFYRDFQKINDLIETFARIFRTTNKSCIQLQFFKIKINHENNDPLILLSKDSKIWNKKLTFSAIEDLYSYATENSVTFSSFRDEI